MYFSLHYSSFLISADYQVICIWQACFHFIIILPIPFRDSTVQSSFCSKDIITAEPKATALRGILAICSTTISFQLCFCFQTRDDNNFSASVWTFEYDDEKHFERTQGSYYHPTFLTLQSVRQW